MEIKKKATSHMQKVHLSTTIPSSKVQGNILYIFGGDPSSSHHYIHTVPFIHHPSTTLSRA